MSSVQKYELDDELLESSAFEAEENDEYVDDYDLEAYLSRGIDPMLPTSAKPGSEEKVLMLSARYAAGIALWHNGDCYDHGPGLSAESTESSYQEEEAEVEEEYEY